MVILPNSRFRLAWDTMACLGVVLYILIIPLQVAFFENLDDGSAIALWGISCCCPESR